MNNSVGIADLHTHTTASDGTCTVVNRVRQARQQNLDAIAITDHDCISEAVSDRITQHDRLELIAGVEVRADVQNTKVELLGYFVDPDDEQLTDLLTEVRKYRRDRNRQIVKRLQESTSLDRSYDDIRVEADGILGRPHIATVLIEEGIVDSVGEAFDEHLANDGTAFVPMKRVPAPDVINAIQGAGGVVSLAHPGRIRAANVERIVDELVEAGLDAIEVQYPYDTAPAEGYADISVEDAAALAEEHRLLQTGGSDCHGPDSGKFRIGEVRVSEAQLDALRERADRRRSL
jgi:predicted metal-dependent phosphoesterase TrpH